MAKDDACTKPQEFTIDKRCYVTDEQKKVLPYSAVASIITEEDINFCTGTFVHGVDDANSLFNITENSGSVYLFTARHCMENQNNILFKTQQGKRLEGYILNRGNYSKNGDWAIYKLSDDVKNNKDFLEKEIGVVNTNTLPVVGEIPVKLVGYGHLKIMSDKEIAQFKEFYINYVVKDIAKSNVYLTNSDVEKRPDFFETNTGGMHMNNVYVTDFISQLSDAKRLELFSDTDLKVSYCVYQNNIAVGCQGAGGSSGGAVFDADNNLIGIHNKSSKEIGGLKHMGAVYDVSITNINIDNQGVVK